MVRGRLELVWMLVVKPIRIRLHGTEWWVVMYGCAVNLREIVHSIRFYYIYY